MTIKPDYDHAPRFSVSYTVPAHKAASDQRLFRHEHKDQASALRAACRNVSRHAGVYTAWTAQEALRAAIADGKIPSSAITATARKCEDSADATTLFSR